MKLPNSLLKEIQRIKVNIKMIKLKDKLNCLIYLTLVLGIKIMINIKVNRSKIIYNNKLIELANKVNIV